ncbi:MAG TPA: hypothetical protein VFR64_08475 [Methylomirabilota bacterium]|nr:hypothetical protein [Methylomirabilota bacterium]
MSRERPLMLIAVRCTVLAGVVLMAAVPAYVFVEPAWRGLVARLAVALVLGVTLLQLRRAVADRLAPGPASALDEARSRPGLPPVVPLRFQDLVHDVRTALRSRRHFDRVLWPRLCALASGPLARLAVRPGRGPSLARLRQVIAAIEKQP